MIVHLFIHSDFAMLWFNMCNSKLNLHDETWLSASNAGCMNIVCVACFSSCFQEPLLTCISVFIIFFPGLHEEVDYSEKLKFSDDEEEHSGGKNKLW